MSRAAQSSAGQRGQRTQRIGAAVDYLFAPIDISFLVFFRILLGGAVAYTVWSYYDRGLATAYASPPFRFSYFGFSWVHPLSETGMVTLFFILILFALLVAAGILYRISAAILCIGFTYIFLLEKAEYFNHYYLICLLLFLAIFLPANRRWAGDVWRNPNMRTDYAPAWTLWLLRFQVGLPYLYGGIAKLNGDWLRGQPMQMWLSNGPLRHLVGPIMEEHWVALVFSWGATVFDLAIVPLLLWRRTRLFAFLLSIVFHLLNALMFNIGVFPWMMIGATLVFFPSDWPRRLLRQPKPAPAEPQPATLSPWRKLIVASLFIYIAFHLLIPFRHWLVPGNVHWTEEAHRFAWRMMLRTKQTMVQFVITDRDTGQSGPARFARWITRRQFNKMSRDPEMLREFAHFLRKKYREEYGMDVEVRVVAVCSLNGRKPQQLIDPDVDLSREPRRLTPQPWILPLQEPFRWERWDVPVPEWPQHVEIRWPEVLKRERASGQN